jgi:hypothetical protein
MAPKSIQSFFKRKRVEIEPVVEQTETLVVGAHLIESDFQNQDEVVVFRGIEFLERDPAKRPHIWEYRSNQQDEV